MRVHNRFGSGDIYTIEEIISNEGKTGKLMVYCTSTACMSVTSDMLSWASNKANYGRVIFVSKNSPVNNNMIFVLGCQVTDLAILNDIKTAERLHKENPNAKVYMGGCLAYRFDIDLPDYISRLAATRSEYTPISHEWSHSINWERPFWVKENEWKEKDSALSTGHLFRDMYPLKIGAGCQGKCKYCTIRDTRGDSHECDAFLQVREFLDNDNVVLISDSPTEKQIKDWCYLSERYNKPISIRNVEPTVTVACGVELVRLAQKGLLSIFHCPIQSNDPELLKAMNRSVDYTMASIEIMDSLRELGTIVATNIIIDYTISTPCKDNVFILNKLIHNMDTDWLNSHFDYWSWNPYFDGHWDIEKAEERFYEYIEKGDKTKQE